MTDDADHNWSPGLRQPALTAQFLAQTAAKADAEFLQDLAMLAGIPSPAGRDFLVDLLIDLESAGQPARARLAIAVVVQAMRDDDALKHACLRLVVNRHFALAVAFMRATARQRPPSRAISELLQVALRYFYRHRLATEMATVGLAPATVLVDFKAAAAEIDDQPEQLELYELTEPRLDPARQVADAGYQAETITISPPLLADAAGELAAAPHRPVEQRSQGFALLRDATVVGCRSTVFLDDHRAADDALSNMAAADFSPFGMELAYVDVVYRLLDDGDGRRFIVARRATPAEIIPRGIFLNGHYQYNYFHWLAEYLSQFTYVADQTAYADWPLLIGEEALAHRNHVELLQRLAGPRARPVIALRKDVAYKVQALLLPPKIGRVTLCHTRADSRPEDYAFAPDAVRRLSDSLSLPAATPWRKLFLGRKRNDRLLNQDAVRAEFEAAGFETVFAEDLDFDRARRLFAETSYLAGPTGASFTNLLLCPRGTTAIILTTDLGRRAGFFSSLAGPRDQRVIYLSGAGSLADQTLSPFEIDPAQVRQLLRRLLPR